MNIFWLHTNGRVMALLHADAHAVKMILEIAQLCSNVYYHYMQGSVECKVYKKTHAHHPMSVFVCQNKRNFVLAARRGLAIAREYTRRFGKTHKCEAVLTGMLECPPDFSVCPPPAYSDTTVLAQYGMYTVPLCMPEEFHHHNACVAYTRYYLNKLLTVPRLRRWNRRETFALPLAVSLASHREKT